MNVKIITYLLIGIIVVTVGLVLFELDNPLKDAIDDTLNPEPVLYIKYELYIYKPLYSDWQVNIPNIVAYFDKPSGLSLPEFGDSTLQVVNLDGRTYTEKFNHDSWAGFGSTKHIVVETKLKESNLGIYPYTLKIYIEGELIINENREIEIAHGE